MGTIKRTFANSLTGTGKLDATNLDSNIPAANIADASVTNVTTLPESLGQAIKSVAGSPPSQAVGDIWYNTITGTLKNYVTVAAAWAAGGNLSNSFAGRIGFGTQTAALVAGGYPPPVSPISSVTEEYNGSSWSPGGSMNTVRAIGLGFGTQTAGVAFGGSTTWSPGFTGQTGATEEYNGSAWTTVNPYGVNLYYGGAVGTQTAGINVGGLFTDSSPNQLATTKEYDGTNWTSGGNINTVGNARRGSGTQTAALAASKAPGPSGPTTVTEEYNGTSWTSVNPSNTTSAYRGVSTGGSQTASLLFGGSPSTTVTEEYDGTSWAINPATLGTPVGSSSQIGGGTATAAIMPGGELNPPGAGTNITQEYTGAFNAIKTVTTS